MERRCRTPDWQGRIFDGRLRRVERHPSRDARVGHGVEHWPQSAAGPVLLYGPRCLAGPTAESGLWPHYHARVTPVATHGRRWTTVHAVSSVRTRACSESAQGELKLSILADVVHEAV